MPRPKRIGSEAEDRAAAFLLAKGLTLVTRRFKARSGEIDLIVLDGETLVIVEVKQRSRGDFHEIVGSAKAARLASAASEFILRHGEHERPVRYDLVLVDGARITHVERFIDG